MIMPTRETDAATAVGALDTPHQRLHLAQAIHPVLIPQVDVLLHVLTRRHGRDEVEHLTAIRGETHVVIKLIVGLHEAVDAAGHRMIRQSLEVSDPVRVDGPTRLKRAANPRTVVLLAFLGVRVNGIVHEDNARPLLGQRIDFFPALAHHARAVGVDDEALDTLEDGLVLRPAADDHGLEAEAALLINGLSQELGARLELMFAMTMRATTREEDDVGGRLGTERNKETGDHGGDAGPRAEGISHKNGRYAGGRRHPSQTAESSKGWKEKP